MVAPSGIVKPPFFSLSSLSGPPPPPPYILYPCSRTKLPAKGEKQEDRGQSVQGALAAGHQCPVTETEGVARDVWTSVSCPVPLRVRRSGVLRSLRYCRRAQSQGRHAVDLLEERGVERGIARRSSLKGREKAIVDQTNFATVSKATLGNF